MKQKKNTRPIGLGSGLSSLLGAEVEKNTDNYKMVPIEFIKPGPWQPRKIFDKEELESLSNSIKKQGIIQPVILKSNGTIKNNFNNKITLQGILLTMYDKRNKICEMVSNDVKNHFNDKVFKTIIPRNVRISEAPSYGQPVLMYDISCPGSQAYASLAGEIINQEKDLK